MYLNTGWITVVALISISLPIAIVAQDATIDQSSNVPAHQDAELQKQIIQLQNENADLKVQNRRLKEELEQIKQLQRQAEAVLATLSQIESGTTLLGTLTVNKSSIDAKFVATKKNDQELDGKLSLNGGKEAYQLEGRFSSRSHIEFTLKKVTAGARSKNSVGTVQWEAFITPEGCMLKYKGDETDWKGVTANLAVQKETTK